MDCTFKKLAAAAVIMAITAPFGAAQTATKSKTIRRTTTSTTTAAPQPAVTADDIRALREVLQAQQQQIEQLRQELARRDQQTRQNAEAVREAQSAARAADQKAEAAQAAARTTDSTEGVKVELEAIKLNQQNAALSAQDDQKRVVAAETLLNRFRFNGDLRVRGEGFMHDYAACVSTACEDRYRARFRARFGIDGQLNQDFLGGFYLASGTVVNGSPAFTDPVSTNETLTSFFERKAIGIDRAFVTYSPQRWKWLQATGGKFAANWQKTVVTFDNDLNPEGFTLRAGWDVKNAFLKNFYVQPMVLMFNELSTDDDSHAVGGQVGTRFQLGRLITLTPSYTILNWNGSDAIAQAANPVTLPQPNTPSVGAPLPQPTAQPARIINANAFTNASVVVGTGASQRRSFVSDFMYSDVVATLAIKTPWARFPIAITGEYLDNLRARNSQGQSHYGEVLVGQTRNKNDIQLGYSFARIEQDAVISQFNESDYRTATNVVQHRALFGWAVRPNVTANYTLFVGRTLNTALQNAARLTGIAVGQQEPFLKRMQLDLIYRF